jgi:multidrug resistance efflux pump
VAAGQILAELATQDLQTERIKRHSELVQHENVYKAALARADRTQLVINQAKAAESRAQLALIDNHLRRSQLRAPFDGVVIKGDLAPQLGAPVQRGDVLLTLAPDNRFRLIVEVDERDIGLLRQGMQGSLALAAAPGDVLGFSVARILPVAVAADGRNYFEVEGALDPRGRALRPGLRGVAKIAAGERPAAWIATHRLIDWLRLTAWSLGA